MKKNEESIWRSSLALMTLSGAVPRHKVVGQAIGYVFAQWLMRSPTRGAIATVLITAAFAWVAYACWTEGNDRGAWIFGSIGALLGLSAIPSIVFAIGSFRR